MRRLTTLTGYLNRKKKALIHIPKQCGYCYGKGWCKCISCDRRGIIMEDGREYICSVCERSGSMVCPFCSRYEKSYF